MNLSLIVGTVSPQFKRIREALSPELNLSNYSHQIAESVTPQLQEQS
jgi:hypothetical protein